jgi:MoxR-like ATPase
VTGLSIYNQKTQEFEFRPGPIMSQVVLADEINRATPKTQSSLLECMEERPVDDRRRHPPDARPVPRHRDPEPDRVRGHVRAPEAQLDRFMLRIRLGYPQPIEEIVILDEQKRRHPLEELEEVLASRSCATCRRRSARSTSTRPWPTTSSGRQGHAPASGRLPRAPPRAGSIALYRAGRRWPACSVATT